MKTISVLLTDDHTLFRKGMLNLLAFEQPSWQFFEACNGQEAIDLISKHSIDVVVLDVRMPIMDGMETTRALKCKFPNVKILILTQYEDEALVQFFINLGVNGFLVKDAEPGELLRAIKQVYYDGHYTSILLHSTFENLLGTNTPKEQPKFTFTERDRQIIEHLRTGMNTKEIAGLLQLTEYTVDTYRKELMHKTHTRNVAELVSFAYRIGIL